MKYYKIVNNNVIVGAITSNDFMRYLPITDCFMRTTEQYGEYATYKRKKLLKLKKSMMLIQRHQKQTKKLNMSRRRKLFQNRINHI